MVETTTKKNKKKHHSKLLHTMTMI